MPDLNRSQIRQILEYLEDTTEINYRHMRRVLENPRALLKGGLDTKEERKFGNVIRVAEQKEFFARLSEEMKLSGAARRQFDWAVHPRNIGTTLRRAQEHTAEEKKEVRSTEDDGKSVDGDDEKKPKGFVRTMLGL